MNAEYLKKLNAEKLKEIDDYLQKEINIGLEQVDGYCALLKEDLMAVIAVNPQNFAYTIWYPVKLMAGTEIQIIKFESILPLGYGNDLLLEIVNPQIEVHRIHATLDEIIKAIK